MGIFYLLLIGSDILLDNIEQDLETLSHMPKGTHIGELDLSWLKDSLPPQFLMQYDYDFLYYFKSTVLLYRKQAAYTAQFIAHTVIEELVLYLIMKESRFLMESFLPYIQSAQSTSEDEDYFYSNWDEWAFDLFGDSDIMILYSDYYLKENHPYHFEHRQEAQFYQ